MVVGDWKYWEYLWLLVVWCLFPYLLLFHSVGNLIIPIDELIFFRGGRYTTNQNMLGVKPPRSCGLSCKLHNPQWCFWAESQRFAAHRQDELSNDKQRPFSPVLLDEIHERYVILISKKGSYIPETLWSTKSPGYFTDRDFQTLRVTWLKMLKDPPFP